MSNFMWNNAPLSLFLVVATLLCSVALTRHQDQCTYCRTITLRHDETVRKEYNDTVCVKIKNLRSKPGIRFSFSWNGRILIQHKLKTLNFPPFCVATPRIHSTDVCLKFKNLTMTRKRTDGCVDFEVDSVTTTKTFNCGCFSLIRRQKITKQRKSNLLSLLEPKNIKKVKFDRKNNFLWRNFSHNKSSSASVIAEWVRHQAKLLNTSVDKLLRSHILSSVGDKTSLSTVDCWCQDSLFVMCECCVPIFGEKDTRQRGCVQLRHLPYHKDLSISFTINDKLKIKDSIPISISQKLCSHHKMTQDVKIGLCVKPSRRPTRNNRKGLCLDIDARKFQFRFKHRFGCVFLAMERKPQAL